MLMQYNVIVIRAGAVSSVMANRLSEEPNRSVLLLEAGPDYGNFAHFPDALKLGHNVWGIGNSNAILAPPSPACHEHWVLPASGNCWNRCTIW
jgi:choline dehydrogenase-like flavoprotein